MNIIYIFLDVQELLVYNVYQFIPNEVWNSHITHKVTRAMALCLFDYLVIVTQLFSKYM